MWHGIFVQLQQLFYFILFSEVKKVEQGYYSGGEECQCCSASFSIWGFLNCRKLLNNFYQSSTAIHLPLIVFLRVHCLTCLLPKSSRKLTSPTTSYGIPLWSHGINIGHQFSFSAAQCDPFPQEQNTWPQLWKASAHMRFSFGFNPRGIPSSSKTVFVF